MTGSTIMLQWLYGKVNGLQGAEKRSTPNNIKGEWEEYGYHGTYSTQIPCIFKALDILRAELMRLRVFVSGTVPADTKSSNTAPVKAPPFFISFQSAIHCPCPFFRERIMWRMSNTKLWNPPLFLSELIRIISSIESFSVEWAWTLAHSEQPPLVRMKLQSLHVSKHHTCP